MAYAPARSSEPTRVGTTVGAYLTTLAANVRRAEARGIDLDDRQLSPVEIRLADAFTRIGLEPEQQHPIGQYNADFYFPDVKLCVEVDGHWHVDRRPQDTARDRALNGKGIRTFRIPASFIKRDPGKCAQAVKDIIDKLQIAQLKT